MEQLFFICMSFKTVDDLTTEDWGISHGVKGVSIFYIYSLAVK